MIKIHIQQFCLCGEVHSELTLTGELMIQTFFSTYPILIITQDDDVIDIQHVP